MANTYAKLKSGNWGVRIPNEDAKEGQTVTVTKKDGTTKQETIAKVVFRGNGICLCAIAPKDDSGGERCAECGKRGPLVADLEDGLMKHYGCCDIPPY